MKRWKKATGFEKPRSMADPEEIVLSNKTLIQNNT